MWAPDVYQGAPSPVTGFMSVGVKAAGLAALLRVFVMAFPTLSADLSPVLGAWPPLTMIVGNVLAIAQTNIKRLLAYSSIANAGYLLMAFVPYGNGKVVCGRGGGGLVLPGRLCLHQLRRLGGGGRRWRQAEGKGLDD